MISGLNTHFCRQKQRRLARIRRHVALRRVVTMTRRNFRFELMTRLGEALGCALVRNREERQNQKCDFRREETRRHPFAFRIANPVLSSK